MKAVSWIHSISIAKYLLIDFRKKFTIYSQNFTFGISSSSQCTAWNTFRSLLTAGPYKLLTISGSNDVTGINLTNSAYIASIANTLQNGTVYGQVSSNGYSWSVGVCGSGVELTTTSLVCACNTEYTVRPCVRNRNWRAINAYSCGATSQTMTVMLQ